MILAGVEARITASCLLLAAALYFSVAATAAAEGGVSGGVVHTVFLWLKQPGDPQHRQQLLQATERLRAIPGVLDIRFGPAIPSERSIVDDSFDIGIYFYFRDVATMRRYLVHPLHKSVVDQAIKPVVERIVVYDFHDTAVR